VKCYGATRDCAEIAGRFFGVPRRKIDVCELGVDTGLFHPCRRDADQLERAAFRDRRGVADEELLCIYTGRLSEEKNPLLLARAVERLRGAGEPFRGLFVGNGVQAEAIAAAAGCEVHPFVPVRELGGFFRGADIGVWPTQESTSMLDAAACGLPIVVNDTLQAVERVEGNGLRYRLNDLDDLVRALRELRDPARRRGLGEAGARKMAEKFSWDVIARRRLRDYEAALKRTNHDPHEPHET
jgi:glycosyltransferase involved in cell wall biosynthesis